jgi:predicted site-specific integrase-resolvase
MENGRWVANAEACAFYGVTGNTLRRWANDNCIVWKRTPGNQRSYFLPCQSNNESSQSKTSTNSIKSYVYCRVSSRKQQDDLQRQCKFLQSQFPNHSIIKDIGSGLNYKRPGLLKLLELSNQKCVKQIVVSSKDRLCRFGFELLQWQFAQNNTELVVLEQVDKTPEQEFTEDILAILQVFACRWNSKRRYVVKNQENQVEININPEENVQNMV